MPLRLSLLCNKHAIAASCRPVPKRRLSARTSHLSTVFRLYATSKSPMLPFQGSSVEHLKGWLEENSIDTSAYGSGSHKSIEDLLVEVEKGESRLYASNGQAERQLEVLNLHIIMPGSGEVLMEDFQVLPSGAVRRRGLPLSEKLLPGESWQDGVKRAILEELGSALDTSTLSYRVHEAQYKNTVERWVSASYPQLKTVSTHHSVPVTVQALPKEAFTTFEERPRAGWRHTGFGSIQIFLLEKILSVEIFHRHEEVWMLVEAYRLF